MSAPRHFWSFAIPLVPLPSSTSNVSQLLIFEATATTDDDDDTHSWAFTLLWSVLLAVVASWCFDNNENVGD
jgi:anti-sigma-K factor RskA